MLLTIGICTYNNEDSIEATIDSILKDNPLKKKDLFVAVYDDCSKDKTAERAQKALSKYKYKFKVDVASKNNGFPGVNANKVINEANSEFVQIIDGDDQLLNAAYSELYNNYNADVLQFGRFIYSKSGKYFYYTSDITKNFSEHPYEDNKGDILWAHWDRIYRTKFLIDNAIYFPPKQLLQDSVFRGYMLDAKPRIQFLDRHIYLYFTDMFSSSDGRMKLSTMSDFSLANDKTKGIDFGGLNRISQRFLLDNYVNYNNDPKRIKEISKYIKHVVGEKEVKDYVYKLSLNVAFVVNRYNMLLNLILKKEDPKIVVKLSKVLEVFPAFAFANNNRTKMYSNHILFLKFREDMYALAFNDVLRSIKKIKGRKPSYLNGVNEIEFEDLNGGINSYMQSDLTDKERVLKYLAKNDGVKKYNYTKKKFIFVEDVKSLENFDVELSNIEFLPIEKSNLKKYEGEFTTCIKTTNDLDLISLSLLDNFVFTNFISEYNFNGDKFIIKKYYKDNNSLDVCLDLTKK